MDRTEIREKLTDIVISADPGLAGWKGRMTEDTRIQEDLGLNSVGMLFIAVMIEETFGIRLSDVKVGDLHTISDVTDVILNAAGQGENA